MTLHLPAALADPDDDAAALALLRRYYGEKFPAPPSMSGAAFDLWDSAGTRQADSDRFTADDLVAVTFLSVDTPAPAARALLRDRKDEFSALLVGIGPDRELADEDEPLRDDWVGWQLSERATQPPRRRTDDSQQAPRPQTPTATSNLGLGRDRCHGDGPRAMGAAAQSAQGGRQSPATPARAAP